MDGEMNADLAAGNLPQVADFQAKHFIAITDKREYLASYQSIGEIRSPIAAGRRELKEQP